MFSESRNDRSRRIGDGTAADRLKDSNNAAGIADNSAEIGGVLAWYHVCGMIPSQTPSWIETGVTLFLEDKLQRGQWCGGQMRQLHERTIHFGTKQRYILQIRKKQEWWILERNKLITIIFGNWNKTRTNSFLEMGKGSSNVLIVFKGSSLTGHCVRVYLVSHADFYYIL